MGRRHKFFLLIRSSHGPTFMDSGFTDSEKQRAWPSRYKCTYQHKQRKTQQFWIFWSMLSLANIFLLLFFAIIFWCPKITGNHSETVLLVFIWCFSLFDHSKLVQSTVHLCTSAFNLTFAHSHSYGCTLGQLTVVQCLAKGYFDVHTRGAGDWTTDLPIGRWATLPTALSI